MKIGILTFADFHGRKQIGSSRIRGRWLAKHWPGAEMYKMGYQYDVEIYQKVYWTEHMKSSTAMKILDVCDPDWLDPDSQIREVIEHVDAITFPTKKFQEFFSQITDKPLKLIPDRIDFDVVKQNKIHKGKAKKVVWFGYSGNQGTLKQAIPTIERLGLKLTVISDNMRVGFPNLERKKLFNYIPYNEDTVNDDLVKNGDIAVLPPDPNNSYKFQFKSNNKTMHCWALGIPVAKNGSELTYYMEEENRQKEVNLMKKEVREKYDVRLSVQEYMELIASLL